MSSIQLERMRGIEWGGMEGEERIIWDWQERVGDKNIRDQVRGENKRGEVRLLEEMRGEMSIEEMRYGDEKRDD